MEPLINYIYDMEFSVWNLISSEQESLMLIPLRHSLYGLEFISSGKLL
jgi:hypothetical protein